MLDALFAAGPLGIGGMDRAPMGWSEVDAFARATHAICETWEIQTMFEMSRAYFEGLTHGEDPFAIPPYEKPVKHG